MKNFREKSKVLTREESKKVLGGGVPGGGGGECPEGTHVFVCRCGTDWYSLCVDDSIVNPDCAAYLGWSVQDCMGGPA